MSDDSKQKQAADRAVEVLDGHVLFSHRCRMAEAAVRWCNDCAAAPSPINIVTALSALGMLRGGDTSSRLRLTDSERDAIAWLTKGESPFPEEEQRMATLRAFLERHEKGGEA